MLPLRADAEDETVGMDLSQHGEEAYVHSGGSTASLGGLRTSIDLMATTGAGTMTLLKAIVRPDKVDAVKDALGQIGVAGMTVTEVRGHGKQKGHTAIYRGQEYQVSLLPKMQVEVVIADDRVDEVVAAIIKAARTGEIGDGRVFVIPVTHSYKIRTGEQDID